MSEDILERLKVIFTATRTDKTLELKQIRPDARLKEDLNIDSLDMVELTLAIEEAFKISIPDDEVENIVMVRDVVSLIEKLCRVSSQ